MIKKVLMTLSVTALAGSLAWAGEDSSLIVEGQEIKIRAQASAFAENLDTVYSGWVFRTDETQALQTDDFDNPAFVFVDEGIDTGEIISQEKVPVSNNDDEETLGKKILKKEHVLYIKVIKDLERNFF